MSPVSDALEVSGSPEASEAPERAVARDMVRRSVFFAAPLLVGGALGWGWPGVFSVGLALVLVLANFALGAAAIGWGAPAGASGADGPPRWVVMWSVSVSSPPLCCTIRHHDWFELLPFAVSLIATHLGLLIVEARHVSASLAFPGLRPER